MYNGPSIDHGLLSPSGHCSKRARKVFLEREAKRLFAGVDLTPVPPTPAQKAERLRQYAQELRALAARGMGKRKHVREAERLEEEATTYENS